MIARKDVAAIVLLGKLTLNGWLPLPGTVTRTVEGLGRCGGEPIAEVSQYGAGFLSALFAPFVGRTALRGCASLEPRGGDAFRTTGPSALLPSALTSSLTAGLDSVVEDESEPVERASAEDSEPRVLSLDFSSEDVASSGLLAPAESSELAAGGAGVREVDSSDSSV